MLNIDVNSDHEHSGFVSEHTEDWFKPQNQQLNILLQNVNVN